MSLQRAAARIETEIKRKEEADKEEEIKAAEQLGKLFFRTPDFYFQGSIKADLILKINQICSLFSVSLQRNECAR